jgi:hypothetical protein
MRHVPSHFRNCDRRRVIRERLSGQPSMSRPRIAIPSSPGSPERSRARRPSSISKRRTYAGGWAGRRSRHDSSPHPHLPAREHQIALTEMPAAGGPREPGLATRDGYSLLEWTDGGRMFVAVSDLPPAELITFGAAFRRAAAAEREGAKAVMPHRADPGQTHSPALRESRYAQPAKVHLPLHCGRPMRRRRSLNRASDRSGSQAGRKSMDGLKRASKAFSNQIIAWSLSPSPT